MRYLFVGDTHHDKDLDKLRRALASLGLSRQDAIIHCGDFGAPWAQDDDEVLRWWQALPYKKIICLGNHENYGWILRQPIVRRFGCRGWDMGGGLIAPLPGQVATIGGRSFWFYPGGLSIDYYFRRPGHNLFKEELLSLAEARAAVTNLGRRAPVDYVISHDGPREHVSSRFGFPIGPPRASYWELLEETPGSRLHPGIVLDEVYHRPQWYHRWYFGHHHRDDAVGKLRCLWEDMVLEDSKTGEITTV